MRVLGIDEAGRGAVLGPLVVCGYLIDSGRVPELRDLGVKDSKLLPPGRRRALLPELEARAADIVLVRMSAEEIDQLRTESNLNRIEIGIMAGMANALKPDMVIIDALESREERFSRKIMGELHHKTQLIACNGADRAYVEVGAASIVAKVHRDREIEDFRTAYGDVGSGYPSDPVTVGFLKHWMKVNNCFPAIARKSWFTAQWIIAEKEQRTFRDFDAEKLP